MWEFLFYWIGNLFYCLFVVWLCVYVCVCPCIDCHTSLASIVIFYPLCLYVWLVLLARFWSSGVTKPLHRVACGVGSSKYLNIGDIELRTSRKYSNRTVTSKKGIFEFQCKWDFIERKTVPSKKLEILWPEDMDLGKWGMRFLDLEKTLVRQI